MVDKQSYRKAMSKLGAAVCIVTSDGVAGMSGATVSAVCSVTDEPATLLVCVNQKARSNAIIKQNGVLCVNVLAGQCHQIADIFAGSTKDSIESRFADVGFFSLETGAPVLNDALVAFDCTLYKSIEMGTHSIFLAHVVAIGENEGKDGLVYFQRHYIAVEMKNILPYTNHYHEVEYGQEREQWRPQPVISTSWPCSFDI